MLGISQDLASCSTQFYSFVHSDLQNTNSISVSTRFDLCKQQLHESSVMFGFLILKEHAALLQLDRCIFLHLGFKSVALFKKLHTIATLLKGTRHTVLSHENHIGLLFSKIITNKYRGCMESTI